MRFPEPAPLIVDHGPAPVGLIVAIDEERAGFATVFTETERQALAGRDFRIGQIGACPVVAVRAGIGKVNAALAATLLCQAFGCRALALSGVAGGIAPDLRIGDVVVADRLICHDYGAQIAGRFVAYQPGTPPLPGIVKPPGYALTGPLLHAVRAALAGVSLAPADDTGSPPVVRIGPVLTGDTLVNCAALRERLYAEFGGLVVEMEGAAVAQVGRRFDVPTIVVRAVSDHAGGISDQDFGAHLGAASTAAAAVLCRLITVL